MYHAIGRPAATYSVPPEQFEAQMAWLEHEGYRGVSLSTALTAGTGAPQRHVAITLDDGYADNHREAFPILRAHGFMATFFVATGSVGGTSGWRAGGERPLMRWDQISDLAGAGMEIGSHTASHLDFREADVDTVRTELIQSKHEIEQRTAAEVLSFAYPYGYYRPDVPAMLAESGYRYAVLAGTYGRNTARTDVFALHRVPIWGGDSLSQFRAKITGRYWWRHYTQRLGTEGRWLISRLAGGH